MNTSNFNKFYTIYFIIFGVIISMVGASIGYLLDTHRLIERINSEAKIIAEYKINTMMKLEIESIDKTVQLIGTSKVANDFLMNQDIHLKQELNQMFLASVNANHKIMQIRILDKNGYELIRINNKKNKINMVKESELQDKSDREYFKIISAMDMASVWHSKIDLNVENGKVEVPCISTLRAGIPIFKDDEFIGIFIINFNINDLLISLSQSSFFENYIIDKDENYILHPNDKYSFNKYKKTNKPFDEDFPKGFDEEFLYSYSLDNILHNDDKAILILKLKKEYHKDLFKQYLHTALFVLLVTIILSVFMGIYASRIPRKFHRALVKTQEKLEEFTAILNNYVITSKTKPDSTIIDVSLAFIESSGYSRDELIGQKMNIIKHPTQEKSLYKNLWETILSGKSWHGIIKNKKKNDEVYWLEQNIIPLYNNNNKIEYFVSIGIDVTSKKFIEEIAYIDTLTGIYNRRMFFKLAEEQIKLTKRYGSDLSFILIDIDHFKDVNDSFGHQAGDMVLKELTKLISDNIRESDIFGRYGGEEFILVCPQTKKEDTIKLAEKLRVAVESYQFKTVGKKTISLGVSSLGENDDIETLIKKADEALYVAKSEGRNKVVAD